MRKNCHHTFKNWWLKANNISFYKQQLKDWLATKDLKAERVLSVGNMNDDLKYFKSIRVGQFKTVDINPEYKPDYVFDLNNKNEYEDGAFHDVSGRFDCILAFELFEYLWNPVVCFRNFNSYLEKGGQLWLSVPFLYPTHNPEDADYLRVTEWGIKKILKETGFEIEEFNYRVWKDREGWMESVSIDGMRFAKNYKHHDATGFLIKAKKC